MDTENTITASDCEDLERKGRDYAASRHEQATVDDMQAEFLFEPQAVEELGSVMRWATSTGKRVSPVGGGTKAQYGHPLKDVDVVVSTRGLSQAIDIDSANLVAEVGAGMRLSELQRLVGEEGLFCPLDPDDGEEATLGGIVAANANGPMRLLHRSVRDQVLGMQVALASGEVINTGGKVMKDVAGYNLTKPMIGSWGTLGIITAVNLKLLPIPPRRRSMCVTVDSVDKGVELAMAVRHSLLLPTAMELFSGDMTAPSFAAQGGDCCLLTELSGHPDAVATMESGIKELAIEAGGTDISTLDYAEDQQWTALRRAKSDFRKAGGGIQIVISVPMSALGTALSRCHEIASSMAHSLRFQARAGNGLATLFITGADEPGEQALLDLLASIRQVCENLGGFAVVEYAPVEIRRATQIWPDRSDYKVMTMLRGLFNPNETLNPGKLGRE